MPTRHLLLILVVLATTLLACKPIPEGYEDRGLAFLDAIPADVGTLVGVTSATPHWARLWFENADRSIVVVTVNPRDGRVNGNVVTFRRE